METLLARNRARSLANHTVFGVGLYLAAVLATAASTGFGSGFAVLWIKSGVTAWVLAFAIVLLVGPLSRKAVQRLLRPE